MAEDASGVTERQFYIKVLGRTLVHLGVQNYKQRNVAIAELVANCWDAGANNVYIDAPLDQAYDRDKSEITIRDDGSGMDEDEVQDAYLVIGRNRRDDGGLMAGKRKVMGRKGIGKLAGFGVAAKMRVVTWKSGKAAELELDVSALKKKDNEAGNIPIPGRIGVEIPAETETGTIITLTSLKHKTPLDIGGLREALARRFSRTVRGQMAIILNDEPIGEPSIDFEYREPAEDYATEEIDGGGLVKYFFGFSKSLIKSKELRGFTVYVNGKTAQAPPFFFDVEGTASGQHGTRYVSGAIEADFLDRGTDDDSDLVSTDRQEIDWDAEESQSFREWGDALSRRVLREWADRKGKQMEDWVSSREDFKSRIAVLESPSRDQVSKFLKVLGQAEPEEERAIELADSLIRAFEYRHFHDVIADIEAVSDDPEELGNLLSNLAQWKVLESRAILEVIKGRLNVIEKFHQMLVQDAPETAPKVGMDNLHDLIAGFPWLLNPDYQVLSEEKTVTKQLREWHCEEITDEEERGRYDFLALYDESRLVVIEIKRSGHPVTLDDLQRLERYRERLAAARSGLYMMMICGTEPSVTAETKAAWDEREDGEIRLWNEVYERGLRRYKHYEAVLEGNVKHDDFARKEAEVAQARGVLEEGAVYRGPAKRAKGLGPQDR